MRRLDSTGRGRTTARRRFTGAVALVALVTLLAACGPPLGTPSIRQPPNAPRVFDNADPAVFVEGGTVYLYGSTNNRKLPVRVIPSFSQTLAQSQQDWAQNARDAMPTRPAWVDPAKWQIWAPSVVKIGSTYWAYFAGRRVGATDHANDQCIGRAFATSPLGPFNPESGPIYCGLRKTDAGANWWGHGALDPEVFRAPDGSLHLLVALSRTKDNIAVVPLTNLGRVSGGGNAAATILVRQSTTWHDGSEDGRLTASEAFLENPSMVYDPSTRTYLLFYSAGRWNTARYNTGFARCERPTGPCTVDERAPFLKGGGSRTGPGGLTVFKDPSGTLRVAYASWQKGRENQVGPVGEYKRQTHWALLRTTATSDPANQSVWLAG